MRKYPVITFEGGEGSGKTSMIEVAKAFLESKGIPVMVTREPGGVRISEKVREIILDPDHTEMDARTEALLYASARRQHLSQKVLPAIQEGKLVLMDRFVDSSVVYQGYVRGIGMEEVAKLNEFAVADFTPDITLFFDVDPEVGLDRIKQNSDREFNRLDREAMDFHFKVQEGYYIMRDKYPQRIVTIDANASIEEVGAQIIEVLKKKLFSGE